MVVNLEAGSAVGQSIAFFEEETDTAKVKSTLEKMLDDAKAREEELQRLPSIQSRIAFFEVARRQHKNGDDKRIQDHQENLMGGVAEVSSDYGNRRMNATIIIQKHFKRWMAHRKFKEQHKGALALQTVIRGCLARRHYDARRKFVVRRSLKSYLEEELVQERCALAKKLHEMKAKDEKHGRTVPKGWKRWLELRFSGCLRWSSQEDCSSATEFPHTSQLQEHGRLSMLKELGGERTEKLQDCHSIAQHEKLASCSLSVDAASQQCHAKHQLVSSALKPPPLSLEDHCQLSSSDESGGESRQEHAFNSTERSTRSSEKLPEFHSVVQCKDHPACNPSVDVASQKVYQCQANTVSSAMLPPQNPPLEEHVQIASLKESGGNHRPEPHDLIEKRAKSSEKLQECDSIVQQEKHASCGQCQTKTVSSAMLPPQTSPLEEHVQNASLKEPGGNHRPEPHGLIENRSKSSEKLQECHSVVQQEKHASCGQCQTKQRHGSSAVEPHSPSLEEHCSLSLLNESRGDSRPEHSSKLTEKSGNSSEKIQECHSVVQCNKNASCHPSANVAPQRVHQCQAKVVTSALDPPPTLPPEEPVRPVPLKKTGGELRSDSLPESIQKSVKPSEKLGKCHSVDQREKHASCKPSVDAATQQFLHCQAMIVASAPDPPLLPPLEESVRPVPLKAAGEEHRSEPSEPIQKSSRPSEKLQRSHSLVQREKHSSCTREAQPTAATKLNVVAEQKTDHKSCRDHDMTELKCQKSQRSTATDSRFHLAHDPDRPSRTNSGRMQQSSQHPKARAARQHSVLPSKIHTSDGTLVWQHRPCPSEICTLQSTLPNQPQHHISEAGLSLSCDEKAALKTAHLELKREWYGVAKNAGFPVNVKFGSPFQKLESRLKSWREHCKHGLHEKAEVEKQEISKPKGWKIWWTPSCGKTF